MAELLSSHILIFLDTKENTLAGFSVIIEKSTLKVIKLLKQKRQMVERHTGRLNDKEKTMSNEQVLKLHDTAIAQIVRLIQLGILTGTDVSDQLRTMECKLSDGSIVPNPEYMEVFESNLQAMQDAVSEDED